MSIWTHVQGMIELSSPTGVVEIGKGVIGTEEDDSVWDNATIPTGSEGSLFATVQPVPEFPSKYIVDVWGALRDYDNAQGIINYFNFLTEEQKPSVFIHRGVFTMIVNGSFMRVFVWKDSKWKEIK